MTRLHPDLAAPKAALRALIDACGAGGGGMNRPDFAFVHPVWRTLGAADTRVLLALALYQPKRLSNAAILNAYQPQKGGTANLVAEIVRRLQPAATTFGLAIVREGAGYRMVERPKAARTRPSESSNDLPALVEAEPKSVAASAPVVKARTPKPEPKPAPPKALDLPQETETNPAGLRETIRDLADRRFSRSQIAARLRVPYATVERVLAAGAS